MKRTQLNTALLIVALGLGAAVFFSQKKNEEPGPPLTALAAADIGTIAIEHPNAPAIKLEKKAGRWSLTAPVQAQADPFEVNGILGLATTLTRGTVEGAKPADLGLEPPEYRVALNGQGIEIGAVEPLKYRRYVRTGGKISLIDDPPSAALDADYSDLVAKNLIPDGSQVVQVKLPSLKLTRSADGKNWTLDPPDPKATPAQLRKLGEGWQNARAMWNASRTDEPKGDEVIVALADRELKFVVVQKDPQLVIARPDLKVQYTLSKALADELLKLPEEKKDEAKPAAAAPAK